MGTDTVDFSEALKFLKDWKKVAREGWNGKGMWVELQTPTEKSKMTRPYIFMCLPRGSSNHFGKDVKDLEMIPWIASQTDLLSDDWVIVE